MATAHPPNINHRRIVDFSPEVRKVCLVNIAPPKNEVVVPETQMRFLWHSDIILNQSPTLESHNELAEILLKIAGRRR